MKKSKYILVSVIGVLLVCFSLRNMQGEVRIDSDSKSLEKETITFILGDDIDVKNPFYYNAGLYFTENEKDKTDKVVNGCYNLLEVQKYLLKNKTANNRPWGKINLVSHGNQYVGLSAKVTPESRRADPEEILNNVEAGNLINIPSSIIDDKTEIELHGCGLGNNEKLLSAIEVAFSDKTACPTVKASKYFEYFKEENIDQRKISRYDADFKMLSYKMGYKPEDPILAKKFANKFPNDDIDWVSAIQNESGEKTGDVFHFSFDVPLKWVFVYDTEEETPKLKTKKKRMEWAKQNLKIMSKLNDLEIPADDFNWWMRNISVVNEDGTESPALWVKGYSTVMCVLELREP